MGQKLRSTFAGLVGAGIACLGMAESHQFEMTAAQAKVIDKNFPGYEEAFFMDNPRGELTLNRLNVRESVDIKEPQWSHLGLVFYENVSQTIRNDEKSCSYSTTMWRFPFVTLNHNLLTNFECEFNDDNALTK